VVVAAHSAAAVPREDGKMLLSSNDHQRIAHAIGAAKATTRGEIVCVVADEAARYAEVPLAWAAAGALLLPVLTLAIASVARQFDYAFGGWAAAHVDAVHAAVVTALTGYALVQGLLFVSILLLVSIPPIRRVLTPASLKRVHVRARAMEHFFARNLDKTPERTGVLIFVSLKDRRAEVLADTGISSKVDSSAWDEVVCELVKGASGNKPVDGFAGAIAKCGHILAAHFPAGEDAGDEIPAGCKQRSDGKI
jgi:putative membrane protein